MMCLCFKRYKKKFVSCSSKGNNLVILFLNKSMIILEGINIQASNYPYILQLLDYPLSWKDKFNLMQRYLPQGQY